MLSKQNALALARTQKNMWRHLSHWKRIPTTQTLFRSENSFPNYDIVNDAVVENNETWHIAMKQKDSFHLFQYDSLFFQRNGSQMRAASFNRFYFFFFKWKIRGLEKSLFHAHSMRLCLDVWLKFISSCLQTLPFHASGEKFTDQ